MIKEYDFVACIISRPTCDQSTAHIKDTCVRSNYGFRIIIN